MFAAHGNGFIGYHWFFLQNAPATYETTGVAFLAVWIFQFAFADTCSTITSGAMIGRTGFVGDLLYSICVTGFIYPVIGHWAWGPDGWLANMGRDGHFYPGLGCGLPRFCQGSTVVHTIGGFIALARARSVSLDRGSAAPSSRDGGAPTMLPPRPDDCRQRRTVSVVWVVRFQPRPHALQLWTLRASVA